VQQLAVYPDVLLQHAVELEQQLESLYSVDVDEQQ
jgi:hypothetical protein